MKKMIFCFIAFISAVTLFADSEIFYDGAAEKPVRWRHPRKPEQQLKFYLQNDCVQDSQSFRWNFVSKGLKYNDLNLLRINKNIPEKICLEVKNTGEECLISFKLVDASKVVWTSKKKLLPQGMEKAQVYSFDLKDFKVATGSKMKGEKIEAPYTLSIVVTGILPDERYSMEIIRISGEGN